MSMNAVQELNTFQKQAIEKEGTVIIIAGPGTGKTKTLTAKIQYLVEEKYITPAEILAITFTKKAASEIKERLYYLSQLPYISTFHALAHDLLNNSKDIISDSQKEQVLSTILKKQNKSITKKALKELALHISNSKNKDNSSDSLILEYNTLLLQQNLIDYDDLLLNLQKNLQHNKEFKNFSYILVDEFQDTNILQYEIIKLLLSSQNLFVIGDPLQSIYSFRGADGNIFKKLKKDFNEYTEITLPTNYRSDKRIVEISSFLFPNEITLESVSKNEGEVSIINTVNEFTEAEWIVNTIDQKIGGSDLIKAGENKEQSHLKLCFKDFAIIYRTHSFARILEKVLTDSGIPYQIIGGDSFYEKPEIDFILNMLQYFHSKKREYLQLLLQSSVLDVSEKSILSNPFHTPEDLLAKFSSKKDINVVSTFFNDTELVCNEAKKTTISKLIHKIVETKTMKNYIERKALNLYNIHMLLSNFSQFDSAQNRIDSVAKYIEFLNNHEFYDQTADKVTLLSIHASKGLEFSDVFIVGFEEGNIPLVRKSEETNRDEEKRLLYVAMTRAKHELYLLSANYRNNQKKQISSFYKYFSKVHITLDDAIQKRENKIKKWKEKKSQLSLF